jgi:hypothetical protein
MWHTTHAGLICLGFLMNINGNSVTTQVIGIRQAKQIRLNTMKMVF